MKKFSLLVASFIVVGLLVSACGGMDKTASSTQEPTVIPTETPAAVLWVQAHGTQVNDGGWNLEYVDFVSNDGITLVKAISKGTTVTLYSNPNDTGDFQGITTQTLNDHEMFGILVTLDGVDLPGGAIYNYQGTIYWYPSDIIPWFFSESTPSQNG